MPHILRSAFFIALASVCLAACRLGVEPAIPVEQEVITTVKLLVSDSSGFSKVFSYKVESGFGTAGIGTVTKDEIVLDANRVYAVEIKLLNEQVNPAEDITEEVISESSDHLFVYEAAPTELLRFNNGSKDVADLPFNQRILMETLSAGTGELVVTLKHNPTNKAATNAEDAGGETDVEVNFAVTVR